MQDRRCFAGPIAESLTLNEESVGEEGEDGPANRVKEFTDAADAIMICTQVVKRFRLLFFSCISVHFPLFVAMFAPRFPPLLLSSPFICMITSYGHSNGQLIETERRVVR